MKRKGLLMELPNVSDSELVSPTATAVLYLRVSTGKQARRGGEAEGFSIPAQREACTHRAQSLGATVTREFAGRGESARSADRPALQEMLAYVAEHPVDYVIVHKLNRLAREEFDGFEIALKLKQAGVQLVSVMEQFDDSPSGLLLKAIMNAVSAYESRNLTHEVVKGLRQKARKGGTPGYAPLGYLNVTKRIDGHEVKVVEFDPDRAEHIRWLFEAYSGGDWSITDLVAELGRRGMKSRSTAKFPGSPLTRSQVHRILSSSYYIGKVIYDRVEYDGQHEALIDRDTWRRVQDLLSNRRIAGDRSWRHDHFLKGSIFCDRCGERLSVSHSRGRGGTYGYFYCLGRNKKRTQCDLPFLPIEKQEGYVLQHWQTVRFTPEVIAHVREATIEELEDQQAADRKLLSVHTRRLQQIERKRQKLIDGYLADAITAADLKQRRKALEAEERDAENLIDKATASQQRIISRLDIAFRLLEHAGQLYTKLPTDNERRILNQAFYDSIYVDEDGVREAVLNPPFAQLWDRTIGYAPDEDDGTDRAEAGGPDDDRDGGETCATGSTCTSERPVRYATTRRPRQRSTRTANRHSSNNKNPGETQPQGSNVDLLAEGVGFGLDRAFSLVTLHIMRLPRSCAGSYGTKLGMGVKWGRL